MQQIQNADNTGLVDVTNYFRVTANQVQTIPQANVYYLIELTSMASENSLYFIPDQATANDRFVEMRFHVIDKDETSSPTTGRIKFYDATGGFDTYPMGFYKYRIFEQTSSTNLDPDSATAQLEEGIAYVRDYSGNMEELSDKFNEYTQSTSQYVYQS